MSHCDFSDLPAASCAHCLGHVDPEQQARKDRAQLIERPGWVPANYPGRCQGCGEFFAPGAAIHIDIDSNGYFAECCPERVR
ncbi:MAG: hypothetical protein JWO98_103 [Frankiales bacterium]|nr:hypothetical protein [Frankiales bacterium]